MKMLRFANKKFINDIAIKAFYIAILCKNRKPNEKQIKNKKKYETM